MHAINNIPNKNGGRMKELKTGIEAINELNKTGITTVTTLKEIKGEYFSDGSAAASFSFGRLADGDRVLLITSGFSHLETIPVLTMISGNRMPMVLVNVSSTIGSPISNKSDYTDFHATETNGFIQIAISSLQELFDTILMSFKISEELKIPVMIGCSKRIFYGAQPFEMNWDKLIDYLGKKDTNITLNYELPLTINTNVDDPTKFRKEMSEAFSKAHTIITKVHKEFQKITNREYGNGLTEEINPSAKETIICYGDHYNDLKAIIQELKKEYKLIRIKTITPIPEINELNAKIFEYSFKPTGDGYLYDKIKNKDLIQIIKTTKITEVDIYE